MSVSIASAIAKEWKRRRPGVNLNISAPRLYSERVQWLKLHDERRDQGEWCDKLKARSKVAALGFGDLLVPLADKAPCLCKNNHDSGYPVICRTEEERRRAVALLKQKHRAYGVNKGEWGYAGIKPQVYCERLIEDPIDCKFHMVQGDLRMIQLATGGASGTRYCAMYLPDGTPISRRLSMREHWVPDPAALPEWVADLLPLAAILASGYRYVRVDLLYAEERAWFGEMTFWPMSGFCDPDNDAYFGDLIEWQP